MNEATMNIDNTLMDAVHELGSRAYDAALQGKPNPYKEVTVENFCKECEEYTGEPAGEALTAFYALIVEVLVNAWNAGTAKRSAMK